MPEDVLVYDRLAPVGQFPNGVWIRNTSNLRCSWEVSKIGLLSFDIPLADFPGALGKPELVEGKWLRYVHPTAGEWGGVIQTVSCANGIVTFDCESWAAMLRGQVTFNLNGAANLLDGLQQAITSKAAHTGISWGGATYNEDPLQTDNYTVSISFPGPSFFANGADLYDGLIESVIQRLYEENAWRSGLRTIGWTVDPATRKFFLDFTFGRALQQTVQLRDRVHNTDSGWTDDIGEIYNTVYLYGQYNAPLWIVDRPAGNYDIGETKRVCVKKKRGGGGCDKWKVVPVLTYLPEAGHYGTQVLELTHTAINLPSVARHGHREIYLQRTSPPFATAQGIVDLANLMASDLGLGRNEQAVSIECVDLDGIWAKFREGDVIGALLTNSGRSGNMIARIRALDTTRGTMIVSGEADLS